MTTFDSTKTALPSILRDIVEGKIQLPDFQRGWVWDDDHIRDLLVSVARSFPVGAVMLLETGGEVKFQQRLIEGVESHTSPDVKPENLILDGQQRLTTLTQALSIKEPVKTHSNKRKEIYRHYYFDMQAAIDSHTDLLSAIVGVNENKQLLKNFDRDVVLDLSTQEKECEELHFPCDCIINSDEWQQMLYKIAPDKIGLYLQFQNEILGSFRNYHLPVIKLSKDTNKEAVCLVFEKVNTGGVSLNIFELITAIYAADGYNLRDDWYGSKDGNTKSRQKKLKEESELLSKTKADEFLQAVTLLHTHARKKQDIKDGKSGKQVRPVSAKRADVLELPLQSWKDLADKVESGFILAAQFLKRQCFYCERELPYKTQIVPLAAVLSQIGESWREPKVCDKLEQWFWCGVLGELYGGAVETRIANDYEQLLEWFKNDNERPKTVSDANFQAERFLTLRGRVSAAYKGINVLVLREGARDWCWKAGIKELEVDAINLDIHHIFPRKWCKAKGIPDKISDCILNKTHLSYKANRKFGGVAPSVYLNKIQNEQTVNLDDDAMNELLKSHALDPHLLRKDNFEAFIADRSKRLCKLIEVAMGKKVVHPDQQM